MLVNDTQVMNIILSTVGVICIAFVSIFIIKKLKYGSFAKNNPIKILFQYPVTNKDKLLLIEIKNKEILLGLSPSGFRTLTEVDEAVMYDDESLELNLKSPLKKEFGSINSKEKINQQKRSRCQNNLKQAKNKTNNEKKTNKKQVFITNSDRPNFKECFFRTLKDKLKTKR